MSGDALARWMEEALPERLRDYLEAPGGLRGELLLVLEGRGAGLLELLPGAPVIRAVSVDPLPPAATIVRSEASTFASLLEGEGHVQSLLEPGIEPHGQRPMVLDLLNEVVW